MVSPKSGWRRDCCRWNAADDTIRNFFQYDEYVPYWCLETPPLYQTSLVKLIHGSFSKLCPSDRRKVQVVQSIAFSLMGGSCTFPQACLVAVFTHGRLLYFSAGMSGGRFRSSSKLIASTLEPCSLVRGVDPGLDRSACCCFVVYSSCPF